MKNFYLLVLFFTTFFSYSQKDELETLEKNIKKEKPSNRLYKIYSLEKDTTFVDTTLSIQ